MAEPLSDSGTVPPAGDEAASSPGVRIDAASVTDAVGLLTGQDVDPVTATDRLCRLRRRGLADDDGLLPPVSELAHRLADASVQFELSHYAGRRSSRYRIWQGGRGTVLGCRDGDAWLLTPLDHGALAGRVDALVGPMPPVERGRAGLEPEPAALPGAVLVRFLAAMAAGDAARAATHLASVRTDLPALRLLHGLALARVRVWSLERRDPATRRPSVRFETLGVPDRALTVLDAGSGGLWADAGPDRFEPIDPIAVGRRLAAVLAVPAPPVATVSPCPSSPKWRPSAVSSSRC